MKLLISKFNFVKMKQLTMILKNEKSMFFKSLKESKLSHNQKLHLIILSSASENALNFLIHYFHVNERIHYHSLKT